MKAPIFLITATLVAMSPLQAAVPSEDPALQLIRAMHIEANLDNVFSKIAPMFGAQVYASLANDPGTAPSIQQLVTEGRGGKDRFIAIMSEEFQAAFKAQYPDLIKGMAEGYHKEFSNAELSELVTFSRSPLGSRFFKMSGSLQEQMDKAGREAGMTAGAAAVTAGLTRARREMLGPTQ